MVSSQESTPALSAGAAAPTAVDALLILFEALPSDAQNTAFRRLSLSYARRQAGDESTTERMLRSLARVGEVAGRMPPTSTEYKQISVELIEAGEDVVPFSQLYRHFDRAWGNVAEAVGLIETTTARGVKARFQSRRLGKIARYTEAKLRDALDACSTFYVTLHGLPASDRYAPLQAEYDWWRERELELADARGDDDLHLPSNSPYRSRYGTWEQALEHFGFTAQQIAERLDRIPPPPRHTTERIATPPGLALAVLADSPAPELDADAARRIKAAYDGMTPRVRHILTARLGLAGVPRQKLREVGDALGVHLTSVHTSEAKALTMLATALPTPVEGDARGHAGDLLRRLAVWTTVS